VGREAPRRRRFLSASGVGWANGLFTRVPSTTSLITREPLEESFFECFVVGKSRPLAPILSLLGPNGCRIWRHFLLLQRLFRA
jgi:hypothetical protein